MALPEDRQNRTEIFLGAIAGDGSTPPEDVQTRLERYLAYFAGTAETKPDEPHTRLERFLDAIEPGTPSPALPDEYQEVEYITASGTQYIDTGIKGTDKTNFKISVSRNDSLTTGNAVRVFGDRRSSSTERITILQYQLSASVTRYYIADGTTNDESFYFDGSVSGKYMTIEKKGIDYYLNGVKYDDIPPVAPFETDYTLLIGSFRDAGVVSSSFKGDIYPCTIDDNIFTPCYRKDDSVIGMFNRKTGIFHTNAGTGTFTKGPDVVSADEFLNEMEGIL